MLKILILFSLLAGVAIFLFYRTELDIDILKSGMEHKKNAKVVIVGGGLAGLSATIEAVKHGAAVTIVEKEKSLGGNSAKATSGINGAGTEAQAAKGIEDTAEDLMDDTLNSGDGLSDPELVRTLATQSAGAVRWLTEFGIDLSNVVQLGGHGKARTHRIPPRPDGKPIPVGFTIVSTLKKYVETAIKDNVTVLTSHRLVNLIQKEESVVGVKVLDPSNKEISIYADSVILTTGGYANDHTPSSLLIEHASQAASFPTTNGAFATGDAVKIGKQLGLKTIHLDKVQIHPTGFVDPKDPTFPTKFLAPEALRGSGAILLNHMGSRFVNELGRRDHVTHAIMERCQHFQNRPDYPVVATMLLTQKMIDKFGAPTASFYKMKGLIQEVGDLSQLSEHLKVSEKNLRQTILSYSTAARAGEDEFAKSSFPIVPSEKDHFFIAYITPSVHYCMGGLQLNTKAQLLRFNVETAGIYPVPGLYGAGEVTGGVHGNNRLGGNSLLECVVFGRIAGLNAAHML